MTCGSKPAPKYGPEPPAKAKQKTETMKKALAPKKDNCGKKC